MAQINSKSYDEATPKQKDICQALFAASLSDADIRRSFNVSQDLIRACRSHPPFIAWIEGQNELVHNVKVPQMKAEFTPLIPKALTVLGKILDKAIEGKCSDNHALSAVKTAFEHDPNGQFAKRTKHESTHVEVISHKQVTELRCEIAKEGMGFFQVDDAEFDRDPMGHLIEAQAGEGVKDGEVVQNDGRMVSAPQV